MNIIKLKDVEITDEAIIFKDLFNKYLKGRYAFWVHMRYVVPFDFMNINQYIACEMDIQYMKDNYMEDQYVDTDMCNEESCDFLKYTDTVETDKINNITDYIIKNQYVTDEDITTDKILKFRTWLATTLLLFDQNPEGKQNNNKFDNNITNMLIYYKNGMFDTVLERLTDMAPFEKEIEIKPITGCCCCNNVSDYMSYQNADQLICDQIAIYKRCMYNIMVYTFSDIDFWKNFPKEFILEFKKYIDNIIKLNLDLRKTQLYVSNYVDCTAISKRDSEQINSMNILRRLSESLSYIAMEQINNHKNYIGDALYDWSSILYEIMEW